MSAQCAAPGEVIVPWNEPEVKPVAKVIKRSTVKLPTAPANRPVPPVMVLVSVLPPGRQAPLLESALLSEDRFWISSWCSYVPLFLLNIPNGFSPAIFLRIGPKKPSAPVPSSKQTHNPEVADQLFLSVLD